MAVFGAAAAADCVNIQNNVQNFHGAAYSRVHLSGRCLQSAQSAALSRRISPSANISQRAGEFSGCKTRRGLAVNPLPVAGLGIQIPRNGLVGPPSMENPAALPGALGPVAAAVATPTRPFDHVVEAQQFDRETLSQIFETAKEMEGILANGGTSNMLRGFLMATLFYEPSTRTRLSFESAMKRLGGDVLTTENAREFSSAAKGESLADTIRTVEGYSDIIVLRHYESGSARQAADVACVPIINAGDGPGQHPTQALLDVYTIERELGKLDGVKVGLVGDLANGRTVRSLAYLLAKYKDVKLYFVAPDVVKMKDDIKSFLDSQNVHWEESEDLMDVAAKCDVIYQTRIQRERFGERVDDYAKARGKYVVDSKVMGVMQKDAIVMHPLPRLDEIATEVDSDPRAAYFRQAKNGLYIRMALVKMLLLGS